MSASGVRPSFQVNLKTRSDPTHRSDREESVQREALRALRVWGDRTSARALVDRCNDKSFSPWREALEVLARLDPRPQTAGILIGRMPDDYSHVLRLLREMGALAEPASSRRSRRRPTCASGLSRAGSSRSSGPS